MRHLRIASLAGLVFLSLALAIVFDYSRVRGAVQDPSAVCVALAADHEAAYKALDAGDPWKAAAVLVNSLRKIPGDDPQFVNDALIDEGVAASRFAVYIMAELMDDATREQFMQTVLLPDKYPTDYLVQLQYEVTHAPTLERTYEIIEAFSQLANGDNPCVRVASLAILAAPYCFELWPHRAETRQLLVQQYPQLDATKTVLQWSLDACREKGEQMPEAMARVLNEELTTPAEQEILHSSNAASLAEAAIPALLDSSSRQQGVNYLCSGITDGPDWKSRFECINQAVGFADIGYRMEVEAALEALATSGLDTPDTVRAKCLLLGYAREAGDSERVRHFGEELLNITRIKDTFDRTLHEEVGNAIQFYADYLCKNGFKSEAAAVYESFADKFPNSAMAVKCQERAIAVMHQ
jgi:hypothetical protein